MESGPIFGVSTAVREPMAIKMENEPMFDVSIRVGGENMATKMESEMILDFSIAVGGDVVR